MGRQFIIWNNVLPNAAAPELPPEQPPPQASWNELSFEVQYDAVEAWSDALLEAGALSVDARDADADSIDEVPLYGEPGLELPRSAGWQRTLLCVLLEAQRDPQTLLAEVADALDARIPITWGVRAIAQQDWVQLTQAQFEPIPIGKRLLIAPSWHANAVLEEAHAQRVRLQLDPGLAFGTGTHPTTRLCLEWLERELPAHAAVIDYGCGSGILAIAAVLLGARQVVAIDIDPQALQSTQANALANPPAAQRLVAQDPHAPKPAAADVVLANILSMPLKLLAPVLISLLAPGGKLVLSGILQRQADEVAQAYRPALALEIYGEREGWVCLAGSAAQPHS